MIARGWDPAALSRALRSGEPVDYRGDELGPCIVPELAPLCHAVSEPGWARWSAPGARPGRVREARVTVVIPCARGTPAGLDGWLGQDEPVDVLLLWNAGPRPAAPGGVTVERVAWLGHGRTRQAGVEQVRTPYVVFSVDDARPLGAGFVRTMVEALEGRSLDAAWARQVPWPDCTRRTRERLRAWCPASGEVPTTRLDHVCALHRVEALRADPLDDVAIAEDWAWGRRHRCGLVVDAPVLHSHAPGVRASFHRTRAIYAEMARAGEDARCSTAQVVRALPGALSDRDALGELLGQWRRAGGG